MKARGLGRLEASPTEGKEDTLELRPSRTMERSSAQVFALSISRDSVEGSGTRETRTLLSPPAAPSAIELNPSLTHTFAAPELFLLRGSSLLILS